MKFKRCLNMSMCFVLSGFVAACGGSGGGGSTDRSAVSTPSPSPSPMAVHEEAPVSTADLITSEEFLFKGTSAIRISIHIDALQYRRAYINICHRDSGGNLQYGNCLLNAPFKNGRLDTEILLAHDVNELGMSIWQYSSESQAMEFTWMRNEGLTWVVEG